MDYLFWCAAEADGLMSSLKRYLTQARLRLNGNLARWIEWPPALRSQNTSLFYLPTVECANTLPSFSFSSISLVAKMNL